MNNDSYSSDIRKNVDSNIEQIKYCQKHYGGVYYCYSEDGIAEDNNLNYVIKLMTNNSYKVVFGIVVHEEFLTDAKIFLSLYLKQQGIHIYDTHEEFKEAITIGDKKIANKQSFIKAIEEEV